MKYMGSKARLSKDLAPIINGLIKKHNITVYLEPFVGGANLIEHIECESRIGSDNNSYLISLWKAIQSGWEPPENISKLEYQSIKANQGDFPEELVAMAGFCASYNAKWFRRLCWRGKDQIWKNQKVL